MNNSNDQITLQKRNRVGYLILNKPPANGYEISFQTRLIHLIQEIEEDRDIKVVVIRSALEKFFCGGADIKVFGSNTTEQNKAMVIAAREACMWITSSSRIFIAALNGHTLGGGLELAMACDLRLAMEGEYLIGLPEINLGLMPGNGGAARLIHLIGAGRATEMLLTGEPIRPEEALRFGLLHRVFPNAVFQDEVETFAEKLATGPGQAMAQVKHFANRSMGMSLAQALALEGECVDQLYETADAREGFRAFLEKRKPNFE